VSEESKFKRQLNKKQVLQIQASQTQFTGPIPPPEVLIKYNEALPSAAERIVAMAESQLKHRQGLETKVIDSNCKAQQRGPIYGLIVCLAAIGGGVYLIHSGQSVAGLVSIIGAIGGVTIVFITGKVMQQNQLRQQTTALVAPPAPPK
jgi:uncharacterized membrane protein